MVQMEGLQEEMDMQDERDLKRNLDMDKLKLEYDDLQEQKLGLQRKLQENIEEMMDMVAELKEAAARIEELETNIQKSRTKLEEAQRESRERWDKITVLESRLNEKTQECDVLALQLKASERSVHHMQMELERRTSEIEDLKGKLTSCDEVESVKSGAGGGAG